ncbi:alpha/beta hydrolase [Paenibacillus sp. J31TS4]|uniref:alpha/beta fold hydrolase n=1 Tax=Paenibacillus sp. J31TS4 TaxID=2807195 RepID=UPI001B026E87|nr:alpha/beta hydrolase [Paenibacillus sp. J31TS4]GIP40692.1 alpha/beta hydrolase [Paenibacillus sp. J31TS4]
MPYLQMNDLNLFYEKMGTGEPLLFLHSGYSRGILAFASQLLDFQRSYTCYLPDFRGHGRTRCESLEWNTDRLAEDMAAFLHALDIPRAHLIGYSLGANVGLYLAVKHPSLVASLATIGTGGFSVPTGVEEFEPEWLERNGKHDVIEQMKERHEEAHRGNWREFMRQSAEDWRQYPRLTEDELRGIRCPALFLTGEHDPFGGEARVKRLSALVAGSRSVVVPGAGHRPHMGREQPVLVNDLLLDWLQEHPLERRHEPMDR